MPDKIITDPKEIENSEIGLKIEASTNIIGNIETNDTICIINYGSDKIPYKGGFVVVRKDEINDLIEALKEYIEDNGDKNAR